MSFTALVIQKDGANRVSAALQQLQLTDLPPGNVLVDVQYSTLNYKDALCLSGQGGLVRSYPHIAGIDMAGIVVESADERYIAGDQVILTGWRYGEIHWGGYCQKTRVHGDWLLPLPAGMDLCMAMAIGTAGFTAMLAIMALEEHELDKENGEVLVTGAAGGVGSIATALLADAGYKVAAVSGRKQAYKYLKSLGAQKIIARQDINKRVKSPLESEKWIGCIDVVGGDMLVRVLGQMRYGASIAAVGLTGGSNVHMSIIPFLLRGVNLLGIDSVMCAGSKRIVVWNRLAQDLSMKKLQMMIIAVTLADLPALAADILVGKIRGRVVVDVNA